MKRYRKTVFVSTGKATMLDLEKVQEALKSRKKYGHLNVVVTDGKDDDGKIVGFDFTGDAIAAEMSDFADESAMASLDEALAKDLGEVGRKDNDHASGDPVSFVYVLNHSGLPLTYGDEFKRTFAKRGAGRVSVAAALAAHNEQAGLATKWAVDTKNFALLTANDIPALLKAWTDAGSPS